MGLAKLIVLQIYLFCGSVYATEIKFLAHSLEPLVFKNGEQKGFSSELVSLMMNINADSKEITIMPFPRALHTVQTEPDYALFPVARTKDREETLKWVGPLLTSSVYLYKRKNIHIETNSLSEISNLYTIGVARNNADHRYMTQKKIDNIRLVDTQPQTIKMLAMGRIDFTPISDLIMANMLKKADFDTSMIERTNIKLYKSNLYLAFSSNTKDHEIKKWQHALDKLKKSGQYQIIYNKYFN